LRSQTTGVCPWRYSAPYLNKVSCTAWDSRDRPTTTRH
jgi:hypothetical protein